MHIARTLAFCLLSGLTATAQLESATAQPAEPYPVRTATVVVPFAPGASTDALGRLVAEALKGELGQPFIVENKPGGAGVTAATHVAKSAPDGYTLLHTATNFAITAHLSKNLGYDPVASFEPVSLVGTTNFILVANPALGVRSVRDLIAFAKKKPDQLTYGSAGTGSTYHLLAELFKSMTGVSMRHVPYRGGGPAMVDVLAGHISLIFTDLAPAIPLIRDGKLVGLGVTSPSRYPGTTDIPTISETLPGYEAIGWQGLFAPAGTPRPVVEKINGALATFLKKPDTAVRFEAIGVEPKSSTPEQFRERVRTDIEKWGKVIRDAAITAE